MRSRSKCAKLTPRKGWGRGEASQIVGRHPKNLKKKRPRVFFALFVVRRLVLSFCQSSSTNRGRGVRYIEKLGGIQPDLGGIF